MLLGGVIGECGQRGHQIAKHDARFDAVVVGLPLDSDVDELLLDAVREDGKCVRDIISQAVHGGVDLSVRK